MLMSAYYNSTRLLGFNERKKEMEYKEGDNVRLCLMPASKKWKVSLTVNIFVCTLSNNPLHYYAIYILFLIFKLKYLIMEPLIQL